VKELIPEFYYLHETVRREGVLSQIACKPLH
jgi:hypothetical protein